MASMKHRYLGLLIFFPLCLAGRSPLAADTKSSVYGPPAPQGSAFVRVLNLATGQSGLRLGVGAANFGPLRFAQASPYRPVAADIYVLRAAGRQATVTVRPGAYYTAAITDEGIRFLEDPPHTDPARAQIFLYNFSSIPELALKTADGRTTVVGPVRSGDSGVVAVNPIRIRFAVYRGEARIGLIEDLGLARGESYSVFAGGRGSDILLFSARAEVLVEP